MHRNAQEEVYGCSQAKLPISRELSEPPETAWPSVLLAFCSVTTYILTHIAYADGMCGYGRTASMISYPAALVLWSVAAYVSFTPMHDASHGSIATGRSPYRALNGIIGRACAMTLCAPFAAFRYLHLQHHKYTNVRGKDPDLWSSMPPLIARTPCLAPLMSVFFVTQAWSYIVHYLKHRKQRPSLEVQESLLTVVLTLVYPLISLLRFGNESYAFWCYALPGYVAIAFLAMAFDYLPHRPHGTTSIYEGTNLTALSVDYSTAEGKRSVKSYVTAPLTPLLLWQNYHVIHHLYPWIPFYRYSKVWYAYEKELLAAKVPVVPLIPFTVKER
jgi:fatty acid desaturase